MGTTQETSYLEADMVGNQDPIKVLLINPPSPDSFVYIRDTNRSGRRSIERTIWPQTSLAMIAGVLQDCEVKIIDCIAEGLDYKTTYEKMKEFSPHWVITNPISSIFVHDMIITHYAKSLNSKTIVISPHAKALKEEVHEQYPSLDHIISPERGGYEVEYLLRELITGQEPDGTSMSTLPPARQDLLPTERYSLPFIGKNFTFVVISRGCPYKCIYCRQGVMYEGEVRYRSVDSVIEEIRKYRLTNIALHSDTATLNKQWMYEFCSNIKALGVRWICNSRVDTVDIHILRAMRLAGCWMICYGIESGDDKILTMNKKGATCEQAEKAVKWTKEAGIKVWAYGMLGMYGDTKESMQRTIDFICGLKADIANFAISCPYDGTEWNRISRDKGWLLDGVYDQNFSAIVNQPGSSTTLVKRMQRKAYLRFYLSFQGLMIFLRNPGFFFHALLDHLRTFNQKVT